MSNINYNQPVASLPQQDYNGHTPQFLPQMQNPVAQVDRNAEDLRWYRWLETGVNAKQLSTAYIFLFFFGVLGVHRFYLRQTGLGLLWLFTGGCLGVGVFVDLFILKGMVRTANIKEWQKQYGGLR